MYNTRGTRMTRMNLCPTTNAARARSKLQNNDNRFLTNPTYPQAVRPRLACFASPTLDPCDEPRPSFAGADSVWRARGSLLPNPAPLLPSLLIGDSKSLMPESFQSTDF